MRGIGVAVITSTCGDAPFSIRRFRCSTPKRCCSSTIARPRRWNVDGVFDQRVRADDKLRLAAFNARDYVCSFGALLAADDQFDRVAGALEYFPRRKIVLRSQNFRGRHQRHLVAVFDHDRRRFERHNRFPAADVAF